EHTTALGALRGEPPGPGRLDVHRVLAVGAVDGHGGPSQGGDRLSGAPRIYRLVGEGSRRQAGESDPPPAAPPAFGTRPSYGRLTSILAALRSLARSDCRRSSTENSRTASLISAKLDGLPGLRSVTLIRWKP